MSYSALFDPSVRLSITTTSSEHSLADVGDLVSSLDTLTSCVLLTAMNQPDDWPDAVQQSLAHVRFAYSAGQAPWTAAWFSGPPRLRLRDYANDYLVGLGELHGSATRLKRVVRKVDDALYRSFYESVRVERLERHSPLVLELALCIAGPLTLAIGGALAAVRWVRKDQNRLKAEQNALDMQACAIDIARDVRDMARANGIQSVDPKLLEKILDVGKPVIQDLAKSPAIGPVSFTGIKVGVGGGASSA
jgi:hypothetical protein